MPQPNKIPKPFAASGDKNTIPESTETIGLASWNEGFPAITSTPFAEGGLAPKRNDFNGIFNALSAATVWQQQGGFYAYDNNTDYEVGNVVEYNNDLYKCLTANGPSSAVKAPTDTTVWNKVMTSADVAALYLPLSGGTLTGNLGMSSNYPAVMTSVSNTYLRLGNVDYNGGASLYLNGKDRTSDTGQFALSAYDGTNRKILSGKPDGTLTWDGNKVMTAADVAAAYLPLSGGTLTGNITFGGTSPIISSGAATDYLRLNNGSYSDGASLHIYGKSHPTYPGKFWLTALDDNNNAQLSGSPDGDLKWDGNDVEVLSAKNLGSVGYVYYKSGLQICWGFNTGPTTGGTGNTVTYPRAFKTPPTTFVTRRSGASTTGPVDPPWVREPTATGMNVYVPTHTGYCWLAIGEGA